MSRIQTFLLEAWGVTVPEVLPDIFPDGALNWYSARLAKRYILESCEAPKIKLSHRSCKRNTSCMKLMALLYNQLFKRLSAATLFIKYNTRIIYILYIYIYIYYIYIYMQPIAQPLAQPLHWGCTRHIMISPHLW